MTAKQEPIHGHWNSNGLKLHYVEWGSKEHPTIIVHHGFLDQCRSWDAFAQLMSDRWHLIILDARGHGNSEWVGTGGSYYFPDYLFDMSTLIEHLNLTQVFMVGHSMGGAVVTYFAGAFPETVHGVVTVEGLGPPPGYDASMKTHTNLFISTLKRALEHRQPTPITNLDEAMSRMRRADPLLSEDDARQIALHATREHPEGGLVWKFDPLHRARSGMAFVEDHARQLWSSITAPVLLVRGGESRFTMLDYETRAEIFENIQEITIDEGGHNLHAHRPAQLAKAVHSFFERLL